MEVDLNPQFIDTNVGPSTSLETNKSKLGLCEVCAFRNSKYTCPRCEVKTCSLKCNKIHKLELECNGERDRTKFIPLNKFTNLDLSSDYRLLEEITANLQASKKLFGRKFDKTPSHLFKLRNQAKLRRVSLKFLPYKFARHRNNTSSVINGIINWHIEWIFVNSNNLRIHDPKVAEIEKLGVVLNKFLSLPKDDPLSENLQFYRAAGTAGIKLFLKAEQKGAKKFYELDQSTSLRENLEKKLIIEYPTIHVVLRDHGCSYDIIDSDYEDSLEDEKKLKSGNEVVQRIINNAEHDDSLYKSLKNLLFISEYSDEEISSDE